MTEPRRAPRLQTDFVGFLAGTVLAFCSRVAALSTSYEPRCPAQRALYQIVHDHFETFRAQAASLRDGEGLPRFVEQEFRDFLQCGWLAGGFARFRCGDCGLDRPTCTSRIESRPAVPMVFDYRMRPGVVEHSNALALMRAIGLDV